MRYPVVGTKWRTKLVSKHKLEILKHDLLNQSAKLCGTWLGIVKWRRIISPHVISNFYGCRSLSYSIALQVAEHCGPVSGPLAIGKCWAHSAGSSIKCDGSAFLFITVFTFPQKTRLVRCTGYSSHIHAVRGSPTCRNIATFISLQTANDFAIVSRKMPTFPPFVPCRPNCNLYWRASACSLNDCRRSSVRS